MSRPVSEAFWRAVAAAQTDQVFATLLTFSHPRLPAPIRLTDDLQPADAAGERYLISRGERYECWPFELTLPVDSADRVPRVRVRVDNVDRRILDTLRTLTPGRPSMTIEVVLAAQPDAIEYGPVTMQVLRAPYTAHHVEAEMALEDVLSAPFPANTFNPADYPGLF